MSPSQWGRGLVRGLSEIFCLKMVHFSCILTHDQTVQKNSGNGIQIISVSVFLHTYRCVCVCVCVCAGSASTLALTLVSRPTTTRRLRPRTSWVVCSWECVSCWTRQNRSPRNRTTSECVLSTSLSLHSVTLSFVNTKSLKPKFYTEP